MRNTIYELSVVIPRHPVYRIGYTLVSLFVFRGSREINLADEIIWQGTFDGRFEDRDHAIEVFERHNAEVRRRVPEDRLLVYEVKAGMGTPVRVPRRRGARGTLPPPERHGGDAAQAAGSKGDLHRRARHPDVAGWGHQRSAPQRAPDGRRYLGEIQKRRAGRDARRHDPDVQRLPAGWRAVGILSSSRASHTARTPSGASAPRPGNGRTRQAT